MARTFVTMSPAASIPHPPVPDKIFELEFWFEWSQFEGSHWRGKVRDNQIDPQVFYRPFANPEDAFQFVRDALAQATPSAYVVGSHLSGDDRGTTDSKSRLLRSVVRFLLAIIRRGT
ncbi:hypothetical protein ABZT49_18630 [Methylobacterium sp. EM32]|uniref:hypothetical protein n=1 Tax=Methylobacterium sp. EM32 TaxID=3163481 RepID=UPI00339DD069